jgi:VanZ family protein
MIVLPLAHPRLWVSGALLLAAGIVVGSLLPGPMVATAASHDKLEHAGAYFVLTFWIVGLVGRRWYPKAALAALVLGGAMEAAQGLFTVSRQADVLDLIADGAGISLALSLAYLGMGGWAGRVERWLGAGP